jgi:hypothetical protein
MSRFKFACALVVFAAAANGCVSSVETTNDEALAEAQLRSVVPPSQSALENKKGQAAAEPAARGKTRRAAPVSGVVGSVAGHPDPFPAVDPTRNPSSVTPGSEPADSSPTHSEQRENGRQ